MTTKSANQNTVEQFVVCSNRATCEKKAPCLRRERFRVTEDLPNPDGWDCVWIDGRPCKWVPYQTHNAPAHQRREAAYGDAAGSTSDSTKGVTK